MLSPEMKARMRRVLDRSHRLRGVVLQVFTVEGAPSGGVDQGEQLRTLLRELDLWTAELSFIVENAGLFIYKRRLEEMAAPSNGDGSRRAALVVLREALGRAFDARRPLPPVETMNLGRHAVRCLEELIDLTDNVGEVLIGESGMPLISPFEGFEPTPASDTVFVIMNLAPELEEVYEMAIEGAINKCQLQSYRVDLEEPVHVIAQAILERIARAKMVIADLTYERQNCYYELGFARGLRKRTILTCRHDHDPRQPNRGAESPKVHFDVDSHKISYWHPDNLAQFRRDLVIRIQNLLRE
jgi:hypothetical protein